MKIGDKYEVTIQGQVVAYATVKGMDDGTATLVVPATLVVMATRTELTYEQPQNNDTEVVITGVDRVGAEGAESVETEAPSVVENNPTETPVENTVVVEANSATSETVLDTVESSNNGDTGAE